MATAASALSASFRRVVVCLRSGNKWFRHRFGMKSRLLVIWACPSNCFGIDPGNKSSPWVRIGSPILETKCIGVICNACWELLSSIIGALFLWP
jgi:hypothetical protein